MILRKNLSTEEFKVLSHQHRVLTIPQFKELIAESYSTEEVEFTAENVERWKIKQGELCVVLLGVDEPTVEENEQTEPIEPVEPVNPLSTVEPFGPLTPVNPIDPNEPIEPFEPVNPAAPVEPLNNNQNGSNNE